MGETLLAQIREGKLVLTGERSEFTISSIAARQEDQERPVISTTSRHQGEVVLDGVLVGYRGVESWLYLEQPEGLLSMSINGKTRQVIWVELDFIDASGRLEVVNYQEIGEPDQRQTLAI